MNEKQIEKIAGPGSGPDYATTEGRHSHLYKCQQEQPEMDLEKEATKFVQSKEFIESKESPVLLTARYFYGLGFNAIKDALLKWIDEYKNYYSGPSWELLKTHIETLKQV